MEKDQFYPAEKRDPAEPLRTASREKFVQEIAAGLSQTAAYKVAYPNSLTWKEGTTASRASDLAAKPEVRARIEHLKGLASDRVVMTRAQALDVVLTDALAVLSSDSAEISRYRYMNCRHCWGIGFAWQWRHLREYAGALADASMAQERWNAMSEKDRQRAGPRPELPTDEGGYGWRRTAEPNPECPECEGEGTQEAWFADTRKLSKKARVLFDGVKQTKNGLEFKQRDKEAARALLAKFAGLGDVVDVRGGLAVAAVTAAVTPEQAAAIAKKLSEDY